MFSEIRLRNRMTYVFKDHVKIVKIRMMKFNVSILNRLKKCFFFVNTKYVDKYNVSLNKTVTILYTILTKCFFFSYLNPIRYLKALAYLIIFQLFKKAIEDNKRLNYVLKFVA